MAGHSRPKVGALSYAYISGTASTSGMPGIKPSWPRQVFDNRAQWLDKRSRTARNIRRKKKIGAPAAARTRNQVDFPNSARTSTR